MEQKSFVTENVRYWNYGRSLKRVDSDFLGVCQISYTRVTGRFVSSLLSVGLCPIANTIVLKFLYHMIYLLFSLSFFRLQARIVILHYHYFSNDRVVYYVYVKLYDYVFKGQCQNHTSFSRENHICSYRCPNMY